MANSYYSIIEPIVYTASRLEFIANQYFFRPIGMNISSVKILELLHKKKILTPKEIMELAGCTKSNISQRLNFLEKKGFVQTKKNLFDDKRKLSVKLTPAGKEKLQELKKRFDKIKLKLESHFSQKEIERHFEFFNKLNELISLKEKTI